VIELGTIEIPKIDVSMTMYEGIRLSTLDRGPGHWPGTAMPGQVGNVVVAGHRTSGHQVFRNIDVLVEGDEILFTETDGSVHRYRVTSSRIIVPTEVWIVDQTPTPTATLFACHPPGSVRERYVVFAELVA
jgi:sortase A